MDYEKKYKEALKRAREYKKYDYMMINAALDNIFPELKENEDEGIRKKICKLLWDNAPYEEAQEYIAWLEKQNSNVDNANKEYWRGYREGKQEILDKYAELEKQGEQKSVDKVEPKFKVGDWVFIEEIKGYKQGAFQIKSVDEFGYNFDECDAIPFKYEEFLSKWTINDTKDGDVIAEDTCIFMIKKLNHDLTAEIYCCLYDDGDFELNSNLGFDDTCTYPATKEQRDLLFEKMHEARYEWDAEKKELEKIDNEEVNGEDYGIDGLWHAQRILEKTLGSVDGYQSDDGILDHKAAITAVKKLYKQKPAWSEEDEVMIKVFDSIIRYIVEVVDKDALERFGTNREELFSWLKSLRPQSHWKPSDEQMHALHDLNLTGNISHVGQGQVLIGLYNDLKKLKGE